MKLAIKIVNILENNLGPQKTKNLLMKCVNKQKLKELAILLSAETDNKKINKLLNDIDILKDQLIDISNIDDIQGAEYYNVHNTRMFRIGGKGGFQAILENNSLSDLDYILEQLGRPQKFREKKSTELQIYNPQGGAVVPKSKQLPSQRSKFEIYQEDAIKANNEYYFFSTEYLALRNEKCKEIRNLGNVSKWKPVCIKRCATKLRDYQLKAVEFINNPDNFSLLVVHGTGTGKTLTALTASQCYLDANPNGNVVVISPASVTGNFDKEMKNKYMSGEITPKYHFFSFQKFSSISKNSFSTPFDIYIQKHGDAYRKENKGMSNDEIQRKMREDFNQIKNMIRPPPPEKSIYQKEYKDVADEINFSHEAYDCSESMVIIDEAHNLKNMGEMYKAAFNCIKHCKKLLLLTATPYVNRLYDFTSLINMLYRDSNATQRGQGKIRQSIKDEDDFMKDLYIVYKYLKGRVSYLSDKKSSDYPSVHTHPVEIVMTKEFYEEYHKNVTEQHNYGERPEVFYNGFRQGTTAVGLEEFLNKKIMSIDNLLKKKLKTVIYTAWVGNGVHILEGILAKKGISYLTIDGSVPPASRFEIIDNFNRGMVQVLIITNAAREGIDLKGVRILILLDPAWSPALMDQIKGRVVRFKSHEHLPPNQRRVDIYELILKIPVEDIELDKLTPSGDEIMYDIVNVKQEESDKVNEMLANASI